MVVFVPPKYPMYVLGVTGMGIYGEMQDGKDENHGTWSVGETGKLGM